MTSTPPAETASGDELLQLLDELFSRKTTPDELEEAFISLVTSAGKTPRKLSPRYLYRHREHLISLISLLSHGAEKCIQTIDNRISALESSLLMGYTPYRSFVWFFMQLREAVLLLCLMRLS
jgi:hypothetical protein